jgi:hypothetical protein
MLLQPEKINITDINTIQKDFIKDFIKIMLQKWEKSYRGEPL